MVLVGLAVAILLCGADLCSASVVVWIGPYSSTGPVSRPQGYLQAAGEFSLYQCNFDDLATGTAVDKLDFGGFFLSATPSTASITSQKGLVAEAAPASAPIALQIADATKLFISLTQPSACLGFALLGLESECRLRVLGAGLDYSQVIYAEAAKGQRRWVGLRRYDGEISQVVIELLKADVYGIDDVEFGGSHLPEPATLLWATPGILLVIRRRSRRYNVSQ